MAVKIRLARRGRKKMAMYDVVIADARAPRDGRFIEKIGTYNPNSDPAVINIDNEKAFDWVMKGAQPTDTVKAMLSYRGVMFRKHLQIGVIKGAITQEQADAKLAEWVANKESQITGRVDTIAKSKADAKKARLEAEAKVSAARAEAILAKNTPEVEEEQAEASEEVVAETATEAPAEEVAETPVEEVTKEAATTKEAPVEEKTPEAPVAEEAAPAEETPAAVVEEAAPVEATKEAPATEETPEAPVAEVVEEPVAEAKEEVAEEPKKEETPTEEKKED